MTFQKGHKPLGRALHGHFNSKETIEKIRMKAIGRKSSWKGKHHSNEVKLKMSLNHADVFGKNNPMFGTKRIMPRGKESPTYKNGIGHYRERALNTLGRKCLRCGIEDIRVLLVHHIDRNRTNNEISNFMVLCRNCHILEHYEEIFKRKK